MSFDAGSVASPVVELLVAALDEPLGDDGLGAIELDEDDVLGGAIELGDELDDDAVELGVDDVSGAVVEDDELLVAGGVAGIDGVVVVLDELVDAGGVTGVVSCFCWQPASAATTAAAAAVIMNRFINGSFCKGFEFRATA